MTDNIAGKAYTIIFEEYPTYLYALVHSDKYGYDILAQFLREIADECKKRSFKQVLIEENISAVTSMTDVFRTASELPQLGFSKIRMAYVDRFADQKEMNEFGQMVAVNRGVNVKIFGSQEEADKWLSEKA
ncbi:MAG: hypothetical protein H7070_12035 [Saprospiraceae bacterium]|nr:hypothetical protein [Pyrinomonadaceae bacterium]